MAARGLTIVVKDSQMQKISELIQVLKNHSAQRLFTQLQAFSQSHQKDFYVVNAGLVKAGKSTLFNALTGQAEYFKTGDIRTTVANQTVEKEGMVFVDTPGINATAEDTLEAFKAYQTADIILFSHNVCEGELQRSEVEFLQSLKELFPDSEEFWKRIVFVGTNADQMEQKQVVTTRELIETQVEKLLGQRPRAFFCVESLSYLRGINENKQMLVQLSHIDELSAFINEIKQSLALEKWSLFLKKFAVEKEKLIESLMPSIQAVQKGLSAKSRDLSVIQKERNQIAEAINLLKKLEVDGLGLLKQRKMKGIQLSGPYIYFNGSAFSGGFNYKSQYQAEREASSRFRTNFYDKAYSKLQSAKSELQRLAKSLEYYETGNLYGQAQTEVFQQLMEANEQLSKLLREINGAAIPRLSTNIQAKVNLSEKNDYDVFRQYFSYESESWYERANIDSYSIPRYETGLFGREKRVEYYNFDFSGAVNDLTRDLNAKVKYAVEEIIDNYNGVYKDYLNQLESHLAKEVKTAIGKLEGQAKKREQDIHSLNQELLKGEKEIHQIQEQVQLINQWIPVAE